MVYICANYIRLFLSIQIFFGSLSSKKQGCTCKKLKKSCFISLQFQFFQTSWLRVFGGGRRFHCLRTQSKVFHQNIPEFTSEFYDQFAEVVDHWQSQQSNCFNIDVDVYSTAMLFNGFYCYRVACEYFEYSSFTQVADICVTLIPTKAAIYFSLDDNSES